MNLCIKVNTLPCFKEHLYLHQINSLMGYLVYWNYFKKFLLSVQVKQAGTYVALNIWE